MANWSVQTISRQGLTPTYNAASAGGDTIPAGERLHIHVKNGSSAAITLTVTPTFVEEGFTPQPLTVSIAAGAESIIGPFPAAQFAAVSTGEVALSWSAVTTVTFAVLDL
jgi:hypothetical protein